MVLISHCYVDVDHRRRLCLIFSVSASLYYMYSIRLTVSGRGCSWVGDQASKAYALPWRLVPFLMLYWFVAHIWVFASQPFPCVFL
jgi:hypothetical protein